MTKFRNAANRASFLSVSGRPNRRKSELPVATASRTDITPVLTPASNIPSCARSVLPEARLSRAAS